MFRLPYLALVRADKITTSLERLKGAERLALRRVGGREPGANKRSTLAEACQLISSILPAHLLHPLSKSRKHCGGTDGQVVLPSFAVPTSIAKPDYHSHCVPNGSNAKKWDERK